MRLRWVGFGAAVLLAVVGWLGGALPAGDTASTPITIARGPYGPVILGGWLLGAMILAYAWWTLRDRVPSARWALTTAALWSAPFLVAPPMGSRDLYSYACQGYLYVHGISPYEAGVGSLPCPWLDGVSPIWRDTAAPYGPLFVLISAVVVALAGDSLVAVVTGFRLVAVAGAVLVAAGLPVLARRCGVPVRRAWWLALAGPLIGAHLIAGPHNDMLMIGLVVAGLAAAAARPGLSGWGPPLTAGVLLGLAVAVKVTAIVVVPFAILLVVGGRRRAWRGPLTLAGGTVAAMIVVTAVSGLGFGWIGGMVNTRDLVQFTSPPTAVGMTLTYLAQPFLPGFDAVPATRLIALLLFVVVLAGVWWRSAGLTWPASLPAVPPSPRPTLTLTGSPAAALHGAALALTATVALAPYFHPWYAVWPLVLLAATTTRTTLITAATIAASMLVLPDGGGLARFAKFPGAPIMTALLIYLGIRWLRRPRALTNESVTRRALPAAARGE
ncbi:MAG: polyprenol phosphomannose-dependent alpha 1,6 mannosyltransferase MptB [Actinoplanes sp.]